MVRYLIYLQQALFSVLDFSDDANVSIIPFVSAGRCKKDYHRNSTCFFRDCDIRIASLNWSLQAPVLEHLPIFYFTPES